nr:hypothetical protein CTI12_AA443780 [Tanacetum cinerariifolium]
QPVAEFKLLFVTDLLEAVSELLSVVSEQGLCRKPYLLEDKQISSVGVFDEVSFYTPFQESKRNDHLDNYRRQEQRNEGIPNKSHPNFREEHKSFSSIFVSNIPWNASVQDLWDICNKWGVSFNSYAKAVMGNKSVNMSGKYGASNAGAESVGVSDCNK